MDLAALETDVARLDAVYRPVATAPIPLDEVDGLGERIAAELAALGVEGEAEAVLRAVISRYAEGSDDDRAVIRGLFRRYTSFRWAAPLPGEWHGAAEFRTRAAHLGLRSGRGHPRRPVGPAGPVRPGAKGRHRPGPDTR
ncbi:hypothetical protein ACFQX7_00550 [Luedemannella flava]